ncbi:MAG: hypothetical protein WDN69_12220 [Aliidongia sp.]
MDRNRVKGAAHQVKSAVGPTPGVQGRDGDWRRFIAIRCQAEPSLYTSIWAQRRSETAAPARGP